MQTSRKNHTKTSMQSAGATMEKPVKKSAKTSTARASTDLSRRKFIVGSAAAAGGGLALGFQFPFGVGSAQAQPAVVAASAPAEINAWVVIRPDETCAVRIARSEMGQGTLTGLAQLVAEELECNWDNVTTESPTPGENLSRKRVWGEMGTGGSRGIRTSEDYVRRGGAAARIMLLQAAADGWNVPVGELSVSKGVITHAASGRTTTYGKVAPAAAKLSAPDPTSITLKNPQRRAGLRDRRQIARHAVRRNQGVPGLRRQARQLR
jgi:isoquinoline 1-oxidoreductase beta subunit